MIYFLIRQIFPLPVSTDSAKKHLHIQCCNLFFRLYKKETTPLHNEGNANKSC